MDDMKKFEKRQQTKKKRIEQKTRCESVTGLLNLSNVSTVEAEPDVPTPTQHRTLGHCNSDQCKEYFKALESECQAL